MSQRVLLEGHWQDFVGEHLVHEQVLLLVVLLHQSHVKPAEGAQYFVDPLQMFHFLSDLRAH